MNKSEILEAVVPLAVANFERDGNIIPAFIGFLSDDSSMVVLTPWGNEAEKASAVEKVSEIFSEKGVTSYAHVSEVWLRSFDRAPPPGTMVSDYEDREEGVVVLAVDRDGIDQRVFLIARPMDGSPPRLVDSTERFSSGMFSGRMTELLKTERTTTFDMSRPRRS